MYWDNRWGPKIKLVRTELFDSAKGERLGKFPLLIATRCRIGVSGVGSTYGITYAEIERVDVDGPLVTFYAPTRGLTLRVQWRAPGERWALLYGVALIAGGMSGEEADAAYYLRMNTLDTQAKDQLSKVDAARVTGDDLLRRFAQDIEAVVPFGDLTALSPRYGLSMPGSSEAAWYPDPIRIHELRYWDGNSWTEHVSDGGNTTQDPIE